MRESRDRPGPPPAYTTLPTIGRVVAGAPLSHRRHDRTAPEKLSGWIELRLTTLAFLHMGSGASNTWQISDRETRLAKDIVIQRFGDDDVPVIPGSSLKGAVRSIVEALGGGCDLVQRCEPTCMVCALFGHLRAQGGYIGRVGFGDGHPVDRDAAMRSIVAVEGPVPRKPDRKGGRRIYRGDYKWPERPVLYGAVNPGIVFVSRLNLHNVSLEELGLVLLASGADASFHIRIGGGKFAGFGRVRTEVSGGWLRRDYRTPAPARLDAAEAGELAREALGRAIASLSPAGVEVLRVLRATLGEGG